MASPGWKCYTCGHENFNNRKSCGKCCPDWKCQCSAFNYFDRLCCRNCNQRRLDLAVDSVKPFLPQKKSSAIPSLHSIPSLSSKEKPLVPSKEKTRPPPEKKSGDWSCGLCNKLNFASRKDACFFCGAKKPNVAKSTDNDVLLCTICYERERDSALKCGHLFCSECLSVVLQGKSKCPNCRAEFTKDDIIKIYIN